MIGNFFGSVLEFLAHVGGFLALIFFILYGVKTWREIKEDEVDEQ